MPFHDRIRRPCSASSPSSRPEYDQLSKSQLYYSTPPVICQVSKRHISASFSHHFPVWTQRMSGSCVSAASHTGKRLRDTGIPQPDVIPILCKLSRPCTESPALIRRKNAHGHVRNLVFIAAQSATTGSCFRSAPIAAHLRPHRSPRSQFRCILSHPSISSGASPRRRASFSA